MSTDETAVRDTAEATPLVGPRARNDRPGRRHLLRGASWAAPALAVRSVTGGRITEALSTNGPIPANLPIDSSVVKDYDRRAVSPDGIY